MSKARTKEQLIAQIGEELGKSEWLVVDQARIDAFADVTEDRQFIHVDPERAVAAGMDGTIAHGMLSLSLIVGFCGDFAPALEDSKMVINYGFDKVRFASPVKVNDRIRAVAKLADARERGGQLLVKAKVTIEIEGVAKPALIAEWLTLHILT